tara:strand:+ start:2583 stop:2735 length:153 start_codon:yes stop_codon:yes gene_type:complete
LEYIKKLIFKENNEIYNKKKIKKNKKEFRKKRKLKFVSEITVVIYFLIIA